MLKVQHFRSDRSVLRVNDIPDCNPPGCDIIRILNLEVMHSTQSRRRVSTHTDFEECDHLFLYGHVEVVKCTDNNVYVVACLPFENKYELWAMFPLHINVWDIEGGSLRKHLSLNLPVKSYTFTFPIFLSPDLVCFMVDPLHFDLYARSTFVQTIEVQADLENALPFEILRTSSPSMSVDVILADITKVADVTGNILTVDYLHHTVTYSICLNCEIDNLSTSNSPLYFTVINVICK